MLILIAHGSRNPRWRGSLEALTRSVEEGVRAAEAGGEVGSGEVRPAGPGEAVRLAFMQFAGPTLPEVVGSGVAEGVTHFRLLPLFMASAGHVENDIEPLVEELREAHPEVGLELLTPVGEDDLFPALLLEIINRSPAGD